MLNWLVLPKFSLLEIVALATLIQYSQGQPWWVICLLGVVYMIVVVINHGIAKSKFVEEI